MVLVYKDERKFHIVTNVVLTVLLHYSRPLWYGGSTQSTSIQLKKCQMETQEVMLKNLINERIAAVHVLYEHPEIQFYLMQLPLLKSKKLLLHLTNGDPTLARNLDYIHKYLRDKAFILVNHNIYIGNELEKINISALYSNKVMYALTRHNPIRNGSCPNSASCDPGAQYIGSHGAFVFSVTDNVLTEMLAVLQFAQNSAGMENALMWFFKKRMGYRIMNPSKVAFIYHNHCVPVRLAKYKRYNTNGKGALAHFTSKF